MLNPLAAIFKPRRAARLVDELGREGLLPVAAIREAITHWDEVAPRLLEVLEDYVREPQRIEEMPCPILLIAHLFAQQRDARACRPLLALVCLPRDAAEMALGDAVTETLGRVMASVFDGDPEPLERAILDAQVDEYVRAQLFGTLAFLTGEDRIPRPRTRFFLERCYRQLVESGDEGNDMPWVGWLRAVSYLGLAEYADLARAAFRDGRIDDFLTNEREFEAALGDATEAWRRGVAPQEESCGYFGDVIAEFSRWACFTEEGPRERERAERAQSGLLPEWYPWAAQALLADLDSGQDGEAGEDLRGVVDPITPHLNPMRHVGRNDPCPCGSGRKYKKCCLKS